LTRGFVAVLTTCVALVAAECVTRSVDGYRLTTLQLAADESRVARTRAGHPDSRKWTTVEDAWPYVQQLPAAPGVDREWFLIHAPERPEVNPDADLSARALRYRPADISSNYEWNWQFAVTTACHEDRFDTKEIFDKFDDVFVFDPVDGSPYPRFRFLRGANYPSGLRTNAFGWRGPNVALNKHPGSIRIAFVGASTTVGPHYEPYSYPELIQFLFNRWMAARHPQLRVEVINAGREGAGSQNFPEIVRQEVLPVDPDLIVYYEGSNQFWPIDFIPTALPPRSRSSAPEPPAITRYSALARRIDVLLRRVAPGAEPAKPTVRPQWPSDLDEQNPDLAYPALPVHLTQILQDLDRIDRNVDAEGVGFALVSFEWMVHPGMMLDPVRDKGLFDYLNILFWPFSYAHMRRYADFQNRVFREYAASRGLEFVDLAAEYPQDPRLFTDAIHMTGAGIHVQAWIVFNHLVPIIERRLAAGEWPRTPRAARSTHPAFSARRLVSTDVIRAACREALGR
jgi:hypothetical protein